MNKIKLEGISLDSFIEDVITFSGLESEVVKDSIMHDAANWLGIDYSSVTYAFVYLSDLYDTYEGASDDENDDEMVILDALRTMNANKEEDYFIVFSDNN